MSRSLRGEVTAGVLWLGLQSTAGKVINFAGQLVLARLLLPEAFGLVGVALTLISIGNVVAGLGVDLLLQKRARYINLWLSHSLLIVSVSSAVTTLGLAIVATGFYLHGAQALSLVLLLYLISVPATAFALIPQVALQRDFRFKFISLYNLFEIVLTQGMTILLALGGWGANGFAIAATVGALVRLAAFWYKVPVGRRSRLRVFGMGRWLKAGLAAMGTRLSATAIDQGDYIVLSFLGDIREVGLYFFAFRLASQSMRTLSLSFVSVLLPALARLSGNPAKQLDAALRSSETVIYVIMPVCFLQAAVAAPFLDVLFGSRWSGAAFYVQVLSIGLSFDAMAWPAGALLTAQGRYRLSFILSTSYAVAFYIVVGSAGFAYGSRAVAVAVSSYYFVHGATMVMIVFDVRSVGWRRLVKTFALPVLCSAGSVLAAYFAGNAVVGGALARLVLIPVLALCLYYCVLKVAAPIVVGDVEAKVRSLMVRLRGARFEGKANAAPPHQ